MNIAGTARFVGRALGNMRIGTKIFILIGLALLSIVFVTVVGLLQINLVGDEAAAIIEENVPLLEAINTMTFDIMEVMNRDMVLTETN